MNQRISKLIRKTTKGFNKNIQREFKKKYTKLNKLDKEKQKEVWSL